MNIDWQHPWFNALRHVGEAHTRLPANVAQALNTCANVQTSPRFIPQAALPEGEAYEAFIYRTQQVPTRDNAHDFFNGLMWQAMPETKRALNALQAAQISAHGVQPTRGLTRDAATLFDENGAVLVTTSQALVNAWLAHDWQRLFVTLREEWQEATLLIFGHATLEKLLTPYKAITTHTLWLNAAHDTPQVTIDAQLAAGIDRIAAKDWQPLPIMGVPLWWPSELGDQDAEFYADGKVFRRR